VLLVLVLVLVLPMVLLMLLLLPAIGFPQRLAKSRDVAQNAAAGTFYCRRRFVAVVINGVRRSGRYYPDPMKEFGANLSGGGECFEGGPH